jgi:hypothetical protein
MLAIQAKKVGGTNWNAAISSMPWHSRKGHAVITERHISLAGMPKPSRRVGTSILERWVAPIGDLPSKGGWHQLGIYLNPS